MTEPFYQEVLSAVQTCLAECNYCATACLREPEVASQRECILLCLDCAEICASLIPFLARGSQFCRDMMAVCAAICARCAAECGKHTDMNHCQRCAEECLKCATVCNNFANS